MTIMKKNLALAVLAAVALAIGAVVYTEREITRAIGELI